MHVWGHEVGSQLLTFCNRGGSRESHSICDAVVAKSFACFEDSLQDASSCWSCQNLQQIVTFV